MENVDLMLESIRGRPWIRDTPLSLDGLTWEHPDEGDG